MERVTKKLIIMVAVSSFQNEKAREEGEDELDFNTIKTSQGLNVPNYTMVIDVYDEYSTK